MVELDMNYIDKLHRRTNMTHQQISDKSGVPIGTVSRVMSGQTKDPSFATVASIVTALGGSLDQMAGIEIMHETIHNSPADTVIAVSREAYQNSYRSLLEHMASKDKWIWIMFVYCCVLTLSAFVLEVIR